MAMGETKVQVLRDRIIDEIFYALGMKRSGLARRLLGRLFYLPAVHFSTMKPRRAGCPAPAAGCCPIFR
jgi:hypothetical protein